MSLRSRLSGLHNKSSSNNRLGILANADFIGILNKIYTLIRGDFSTSQYLPVTDVNRLPVGVFSSALGGVTITITQGSYNKTSTIYGIIYEMWYYQVRIDKTTAPVNSTGNVVFAVYVTQGTFIPTYYSYPAYVTNASLLAETCKWLISLLNDVNIINKSELDACVYQCTQDKQIIAGKLVVLEGAAETAVANYGLNTQGYPLGYSSLLIALPKIVACPIGEIVKTGYRQVLITEDDLLRALYKSLAGEFGMISPWPPLIDNATASLINSIVLGIYRTTKFLYGKAMGSVPTWKQLIDWLSGLSSGIISWASPCPPTGSVIITQAEYDSLKAWEVEGKKVQAALNLWTPTCPPTV